MPLAGLETEKYKQKLYSADIVIAFISADFIDDEEPYQRTKKVIARYNNNETARLPIRCATAYGSPHHS